MIIPNIIKLQDAVRELQQQMLDFKEQELRNLLTTDDKFSRLNDMIKVVQTLLEVQQGTIELLTLQQSMHNAHIENLIERVAELENPSPPIPCTCGYGGEHDPDNPRCDRNKP